MDRETPFTADEVYWNHRVIQRDRRTKQLTVRLLLVPRARLAGMLTALRRAGIAPHRIEIEGGPDRDCHLPLDGDGSSYEPLTRRLLWPAFASCIALAIGAAATPFVLQSTQLAAVESRIASERGAAAEAQALRQQIDRASGSAVLIEKERDRGGRPLAVLAALTRLIPPDTYLTDFVQQQGKVTLTGRSTGASRLIGSLAAGKELRNPTFAAPVTRIAAGQLEQFTVTVEVTP